MTPTSNETKRQCTPSAKTLSTSLRHASATDSSTVLGRSRWGANFDQTVVAGIATSTRSKILFVPSHPSADRLQKNHTSQVDLACTPPLPTSVDEAIRERGKYGLSDGTYRNALNQSGRLSNMHRRLRPRRRNRCNSLPNESRSAAS